MYPNNLTGIRLSVWKIVIYMEAIEKSLWNHLSAGRLLVDAVSVLGTNLKCLNSTKTWDFIIQRHFEM